MSGGFRLQRGARPLPEGGVQFSVWAPRARSVAVRARGGDAPAQLALQPTGVGVFNGLWAEARPGLDYVYLLDGRRERPDPVSRHQPAGVHGPSRVVDPAAFSWSDSAWRGIERADLVIYELHVGTFTTAGTFEAAVEPLAALRQLGVTAIELMPVAEFPGTRNWGYDGVFPYAPQSSYGGPQGLRRLVDAAHAVGLAVILDVVYNHLGPEGNVLPDFGPYFTDRYRTPWGQALNFDGPESDEVRRYFVDNALYWLAEFHLDGLRLDAVHAIHDESARPLLAELAQAVDGLAPALGRPLHLVAESDANDPRLVRGREQGGLGLGAVWSDDFHHALHGLLTGERHAYYADFGEVAQVAKALADRFVLDGGYSQYRRRRHGAPAADLPADRFVVCAQNHDQVGNRALGERLASLLPPERLRLAAALVLLSPYLPLLFMGEEYGETAPFLYFVDHGDLELREAVRRGRRREFAAFHGTEEPPDPAAEETFRRSRLDRSRAATPGGRALRRLYARLLALRREEPALRPGAAEVSVSAEPGEGWILAEYRPAAGRPAFAAFHFGRAKAQARVPAGGPWRLRLATDDAEYGGPGSQARAHLAGGCGPGLLLPPDTALLYASEVA